MQKCTKINLINFVYNEFFDPATDICELILNYLMWTKFNNNYNNNAFISFFIYYILEKLAII